MSLWIAFDTRTAAALETGTGSPVQVAPVQVATGNALDYALQAKDANALLLLPTRGGEVLIATLRRAAAAPSALPPNSAAVSYSAGGFLGLTDELVLEEGTPQAKRWWQKLLQ